MTDNSTLTLKSNDTSSGCTPDPIDWTPAGGSNVTISNTSGSEQTLSNITNGCLIKPGTGVVTSITIANNGNWTGKAAAKGKNGQYDYQDGSNKRGLRNGKIDPS
jgi:hypothetical protein